MADLTATLLACQNPDANIRTQAERALVQAEQSNYGQFALALANELATEGKDITVRQLAGIHLKNLYVAKEENLQQSKHEAWMRMDAQSRSSVKNVLLQTIASKEAIARHTAAQASSEIAAVELPYSQWPEFLDTLMHNVTSPEIADPVKETSLECLGFTCERIAALDNAPDMDPAITDRMLTAIVEGIRADRPDSIRYSAATALRNSLLFTRKNMDVEAERNMIMKAICEAAQSPAVNVRAAAFECIVQIAFQFYDKLGEYMHFIFGLTTNAMEKDEEKVALMAIEFWSTVCEEEIDLIDEEIISRENGEQPSRYCMRYIAGALEKLGPLLTHIMTKQDEDADEDTWNLSMSAATCLSLVASTVGDSVVSVITPFIQQHIKSENWRYREAATMAFSSILEGPSSETMGPIVQQSIPILLQALSDPHDMVKDTTAWTIGRICSLHVRSIPSDSFPMLVDGLMKKLMTESANVSSQSCYALHNLADAFSEDDSAANTGTNLLSQYMQPLLATLLQVIDRDDADDHYLRVHAFEAISSLVLNSAPDVKNLLVSLLPVILERLHTSFSYPALTNEDKERKEGIQGLLCSLLVVLIQKVDRSDVMPLADLIMQNLLQVLQVKNATCHEEAFSAIGVVCDKCESAFDKYTPALMPFLSAGLTNYQAYHVCSIAVGLVGDLSRSLESRIQPFCNEIMTALVQSLQNADLHRSVKPPVLSCFGDIAMAIGADFEPYLQISMMMLMQASGTTIPDDDDELYEFVIQLRESVLEAYTGILQGLSDGGKVDLVIPYVSAIMSFIESLYCEDSKDSTVMGKAAGLLGDIASLVGKSAKPYLSKPFVYALLGEVYATGDESTKSTCNWARGVVQAAIS